jgi:RNase P subunit RPR2
MPKTIYCDKCGTVVGELANGSKTKKGITYICRECRQKQAINDYSTDAKGDTPFGDIFRDIFDNLQKSKI